MHKKIDTINADVYVQFVRSLYENVHMILIGATCHAVAASLAYFVTSNPLYLWLAIGLGAIGVWRFCAMMGVVRGGTISCYEAARRCERAYIIQGSVQGLALGFFCFVSIYLVPNGFAEFASLSVTMGSMVTVVGRNYGSRSMVAIFAVTFILPISIGLFMRGDTASIVLGLLIFPFMFVVRGTAERVREVLFSAVVGHSQAKQIAHRFDRALNTMSHGLIMLDANGVIVVANSEAAKTVGIRSVEHMIGRTLNAILMRGAAAGLLTLKDCHYVEVQLARALHDKRDRKLLLSFTDGRHLELTAREGSDELGVITFEDVTARIQAEERIRFMARYDNLTGLPNRAYFHEIVTEFLAAGDRSRLCMLAVFDLDDFKSVNDTLGHPVGDGFIYAVAARLQQVTTETVKVARFGGDEFMIFADQIASEEHAKHLLAEVFASLSGDVDVAGHAIPIQISAGAVVSIVADADVDGLTVKADLALYKAKERGKNSWCLFETEMDDAFRNRQILKSDLRAAVADRLLRVVYQPIVKMESMRIASSEALCRWDHPTLGAISPVVFIPLAEEMGIISDISIFVLNAACKDCTNWPEPIGVSVNLSAKDFRNRDIVDIVRKALENSGLAAHRLEIEITETAVLDDRETTSRYLNELKALGIQIALDDFGTGYSSLSYLHSLPFDKVKIDRTFVSDLTQSARSVTLLHGMVELSRTLGLAITVEGVETYDQLRVISNEIQPTFLQGFLFGSALTASGIATISSTMWPFVSGGKIVPSMDRGSKALD